MSRKNNRKFHKARHEAALKWEKKERSRREERFERKAQLEQLTKAMELLGGGGRKEEAKAEEQMEASDSVPAVASAEEASSDEDEDMEGKKPSKKSSKRQAGAKVKKILCKDATLKKKALARLKARAKKRAMLSDDEEDPKDKVVAVVRGHRQGVKEIHRCRDKKILRQILKREREFSPRGCSLGETWLSKRLSLFTGLASHALSVTVSARVFRYPHSVGITSHIFFTQTRNGQPVQVYYCA
ncbi:hypothetical protein BESB_082820 [Besnoitia besnoiti]|uniref:Uncharacterized protein n=1 Tax=Besnoitia besnoiti TaxID=94643 RepID=A0A2A9MBN2_BESBE|nr:hypothetical protein BESB_082820 [Besnoitia besnoiti]PFH33083.1 hypothetical protein BESB_082820 [Besnoitia besnoiti]